MEGRIRTSSKRIPVIIVMPPSKEGGNLAGEGILYKKKVHAYNS